MHITPVEKADVASDMPFQTYKQKVTYLSWCNSSKSAAEFLSCLPHTPVIELRLKVLQVGKDAGHSILWHVLHIDIKEPGSSTGRSIDLARHDKDRHKCVAAIICEIFRPILEKNPCMFPDLVINFPSTASESPCVDSPFRRPMLTEHRLGLTRRQKSQYYR